VSGIRAGVDDAAIRRALEQADPTALRTAIYQLTGDEDLVRIELGTEPSLLGEIPAITDPQAVALVRERAFHWLRAYLEGRVERRPPPSRDELAGMLHLCVGAEIPADYVDLYLEELGLAGDDRALRWAHPPSLDALNGFRVAIIGAGIGGLCAAIRCQQAGVPYTVFEKNQGVGGTWWENVYPDARVDVPSQWYSYTFAVDYAWEHTFARQQEIRGYLEHVARQRDVLSRIRFGCEVVSARWEEARGTWRLLLREPDGGERVFRANAVISAVGMLNRPRMPDLEGVGDFAGPIFHTARWDRDCDLRGKRVAVVGTGASAMQLVPALAPVVGQLAIFQRSPGWVFGVPGYRDPLGPDREWLHANLPYYPYWLRLRIFSAFSDRACLFSEVDPGWRHPDSVSEANEGVRRQLVAYLMEKIGDDPELVKKCLPGYPPMAKRFILDNGWFDALRRDNVELITDPIERITTRGIAMRGGRELELDAVVLATGFWADRYLWPMAIEGRGGVKLSDVWSHDGARAYLGITIPRFPNLFCLYGPNTNPRAGSVCTMHELQVRYAMGCIQLLLEGGHRALDCRQDVHDDFNRRLDQKLGSTIWTDRRQESYYRNAQGRITTNSPWRLLDYWRWTQKPNLADYELV